MMDQTERTRQLEIIIRDIAYLLNVPHEQIDSSGVSEFMEEIAAGIAARRFEAPPDGNAVITATLTIPVDLLQAALQHLRDFDAAHSDSITMLLGVNAPSVEGAAMEAIYRNLQPPFANVVRSTSEPST